jgi:hypothetical protein
MAQGEDWKTVREEVSRWLEKRTQRYHDFAIEWKEKSNAMATTHPDIAVVCSGLAKQFQELEDVMSVIKLLETLLMNVGSSWSDATAVQTAAFKQMREAQDALAKGLLKVMNDSDRRADELVSGSTSRE